MAGGGGATGDRLVHEVVAEQAVRRPDAVAVIAGRTQVSYRELDSSANRLARYLGEIGAGPEAVIGVYLERGVDVIRAILADLEGGRRLPAARPLPAAGAAERDLLPGPADGGDRRPGGHVPRHRDAAAATGRAGRRAGGPGHAARWPSCIPTTSATPSTPRDRPGTPSRSPSAIGSLACVIAELAGEYEIADDDRVAQMASMAFDTSIEQVFVALTSGATLLLPPPGTMAPSELLRRIERRHATVLDLTPAYWHQLLALTGPADERLRSVRLMITGGEPADPEVCRTALRAAPWARLLNAYGLTETTITSALFDVGAGLAAADQPEAARCRSAGRSAARGSRSWTRS